MRTHSRVASLRFIYTKRKQTRKHSFSLIVVAVQCEHESGFSVNPYGNNVLFHSLSPNNPRLLHLDGHHQLKARNIDNATYSCSLRTATCFNGQHRLPPPALFPGIGCPSAVLDKLLKRIVICLTFLCLQIWRRSYATPPPSVEITDERWPGKDPKYQVKYYSIVFSLFQVFSVH